jgi:hypothetical protein
MGKIWRLSNLSSVEVVRALSDGRAYTCGAPTRDRAAGSTEIGRPAMVFAEHDGISALQVVGVEQAPFLHR